jgi:hypothetical protein
MKKLMIAAAAAAMIGGAYADLCDEVIDSASCALYNVKFTFKTLGGKDAKCTAAQLAGAACGNLLANGEEGIAYLDNSTRKFEGILWQCKTDCFEGVAPNEQKGGAINYVLWEKKYERAVSPKATYDTAQDADPRWYSDDEADNFDILGRYGKKAQKVAAFWTPTMGSTDELIYAAGFGSFDSKNLRIKSVSGNAVGKLKPINLVTENLCDDDQLLTVLAYMCSDFKSWCCCECVAAAVAPASGTWSLKYNSSLSKKGKLSKIIPVYAYDKK